MFQGLDAFSKFPEYKSVMYQGHKGICQTFASGKYCRFGRHCRYLHLRKSDISNFDSSGNQSSDGAISNIRAGSQINSSNQIFESDAEYHQHGNEVNSTENKVPQFTNTVVSVNSSPCRYYSEGNCRKGDACKFIHQSLPNDGAYSQKQNEKNVDDTATRVSSKICQHFRRGYCRYGNTCRMLHSKDGNSNRPNVAHNATGPRFVASFIPKLEYDLKDLDEKSMHDIREKDIDYIKKRFPKCETIAEGSYKIEIKPTDPDWPYDVRNLILSMNFKSDYPKTPLSVRLDDNEQLPETVKRYVWKSIEEWVETRHKACLLQGRVEIVVRTLLRWIDRNLENMFTTALKTYQKELVARAAGIEFVPATQLREELAKNSSESEDEHERDEEASDSEDENSDSEEDGTVGDDLVANPNHVSSLDAAKHGTEVKLQQLQMTDNAASLVAERVTVIVQCARCKNKTEFETPPGRINVFSCMKCGAEQLATFRVNMAHQFTSIIGYLDLKECSVHDLVLSACQFKVGCLECGRDMNYGGLIPGQIKETWCHSCHCKMTVAANSVKFLNLQQSDLETVTDNIHQLNIKKAKKVPKDPAIKEGQPLPSEGTCKHYKKSYRWLRFPCCGKAYPCDICHDDNEDHEFTFANRMICGFCCKEQQFSPDRPCKGCSSSLTKKNSSHWEGGKGCRDRIKMSRNDEAKFKNMKKTVSKKAQGKPSSSKNTKLRHN